MKTLIFLGVQRHKYWSDFKLSLYVVTYYEVTSLYRIVFFLKSIIEEKTGVNRVLYYINGLYKPVVGRISTCSIGV